MPTQQNTDTHTHTHTHTYTHARPQTFTNSKHHESVQVTAENDLFTLQPQLQPADRDLI